MKSKTKVLAVILVCLLALMVPIACGETPSVSLNQGAITLEVGETAQLTATLEDVTGDVVWTTSDEAIASVSSGGGLVTAVAVGSATITATVGEYSATCTITVTRSTSAVLTMSQTTASMDVYERLTLVATKENIEGDITWTSSDTTKATVVGGVVTTLAAGEVTITASAGGQTVTCAITITSSGQVPLLQVDRTSIVIRRGQNMTVTPTLRYKGEEVEGEISFVSTDTTKATVDENGRITGTGVTGDNLVTITVTATYNGYTTMAGVTVKVTDNVSFSLDSAQANLAVSAPTEDYKTQQTIVPTVTDNGTTISNPTLTWESEDGSVATVADGVITAVGVGSTTVSVTYNSTGGDTFTLNVTVVVVLPELQSPTVMTIDLNADENTTVSIDLNGIVAASAVTKVEEISSVTEDISFTVNGTSIVMNKEDLYSGEKRFRIVTPQVAFVSDVIVATKIINTVADLDNMQKYAAADKSTRVVLDGDNLTTEQRNDIKGTWGDYGYKMYSYGGYFMLGGNIQYNKTIPDWCGRMANGNRDEVLPTLSISSNNSTQFGFHGTFNGNGYAIYGMTVAGANSGLVGTLGTNGVIKNLSLINARTLAQSGVVASLIHGTVENVYVHGSSADIVEYWGRCGLLGGKADGNTRLINVIVEATSIGGGDNNSLFLGSGNPGMTISNCIAIGSRDGSTPYKLYVADAAGVANIKTYANRAAVIADAEKDYSGFSGGVWNTTGNMPVMTNTYADRVNITNTELSIRKGETLQIVSSDSDVVWSIKTPSTGISITDGGMLSVTADTTVDSVTVVAASTACAAFYDEITLSIPQIIYVDKTSSVSAEWLLTEEEAYTVDVDSYAGALVSVTIGDDDVAGVTAAGSTLTFTNATVKSLGWGEKTLVAHTETHDYAFKVLLVNGVITSAEQFNALSTSAVEVNADSVGGYFKLGANIDFAGAALEGVGTAAGTTPAEVVFADKWAGVFDGCGYMLSNFKITESFGGLFSYVATDGVVRNLAITNATLDCDYAGIVSTKVDGEVSNLFISASFVNGRGDSDVMAPALVTATAGHYAKIKNVFAITTSWSYKDYNSDGGVDNTYGAGIVGTLKSDEYINGYYSEFENLYHINAPAVYGVGWGAKLEAIGNNYACRVTNAVDAPPNDLLHNTDSDTIAIHAPNNIMVSKNIKSFTYGYAELADWLGAGNDFVEFGSLWDNVGAMPVMSSATAVVSAMFDLNALFEMDPEGLNAFTDTTSTLRSTNAMFPGAFSIKEAVEGVSIENNVLSIAADTSADTVTVVLSSHLFPSVNKEYTITIYDLVQVDLTATILAELDLNGDENQVITVTGLDEAVTRVVYGSTDIAFVSSEGADITFMPAALRAVLPVGVESELKILTATKLYRVRVFSVSKVLTTKAHMQNLDSYVVGNDSGVTGYFVLGADIDCENAVLAGVGRWQNVWIRMFTGTFDGRGYTISNFAISENNGGLFSCVVYGSVFKDFTLYNVDNRSCSGALSTEFNGSVSNVVVVGKITGGGENWAPSSLLISKFRERAVMENCIAILESGAALECGGILAGRMNAAGNPGTVRNSVAINLSGQTYYAFGSTAGAAGGRTGNGLAGNTSVLNFTSYAEYLAWRAGEGYNADIDGWAWAADEGDSVINTLVKRQVKMNSVGAEVPRESTVQVNASGAVTYSIEGEATTGVSINESGLVTVAANAVGGTTFTVVATSILDPTVTVRVTYTVSHYTNTALEGTTRANWTRDVATDDHVLDASGVSGTINRVTVGGTELAIKSIDGTNITFDDSEVEKLTSGTLEVIIYTEEFNAFSNINVTVKKVVTTAEELAQLDSFVTMVGDDADAIIELGANIDMQGAELAGIGSSTNGTIWARQFIGSIDGKGYTISNVKITENYGGLVSYIKAGGAVKNLAIIGAEVAMAKGGLIATYAEGEISNVFLRGSISAVTGNGSGSYPVALGVSEISTTAKVESIFAICDDWTYNQNFGGMIISKADAGTWRSHGYANVSNLYSVDSDGPDTWRWNTNYSAVGNSDGGKGVNNPNGTASIQVTDTHLMIKLGVLAENDDFHVRSFFNFAQYNAWVEEGNAPVGFTSEVWTTVNGYPVFKTCSTTGVPQPTEA